jgi:hypothetical protein
LFQGDGDEVWVELQIILPYNHPRCSSIRQGLDDVYVITFTYFPQIQPLPKVCIVLEYKNKFLIIFDFQGNIL